jgi:3-hexulose-6-phosphate synthase
MLPCHNQYLQVVLSADNLAQNEILRIPLMKLQLALDGDIDSSITILQAVRPYIDIAEIGTPLVYREGIGVARRLRAIFPDITLLADFKIMDAGEEEASIAFEAGCDIVSVLGMTQDETLQGALAAARRFGKQVLVDLIGVPDLLSRADALLAMGCHYLCVHTAHDLQAGHSPLEHLKQLRQHRPDAPLAVAGGIKLGNMDSVLVLNPEIVVVGSAITQADDPAQVAYAFRERIQSYDRI